MRELSPALHGCFRNAVQSAGTEVEATVGLAEGKGVHGLEIAGRRGHGRWTCGGILTRRCGFGHQNPGAHHRRGAPPLRHRGGVERSGATSPGAARVQRSRSGGEAGERAADRRCRTTFRGPCVPERTGALSGRPPGAGACGGAGTGGGHDHDDRTPGHGGRAVLDDHGAADHDDDLDARAAMEAATAVPVGHPGPMTDPAGKMRARRRRTTLPTAVVTAATIGTTGLALVWSADTAPTNTGARTAAATTAALEIAREKSGIDQLHRSIAATMRQIDALHTGVPPAAAAPTTTTLPSVAAGSAAAPAPHASGVQAVAGPAGPAGPAGTAPAAVAPAPAPAASPAPSTAPAAAPVATTPTTQAPPPPPPPPPPVTATTGASGAA